MSALVGRLFQIVGMIILPIGLYVGMVQNDVRMEVKLLALGGGVFVAGWLMARKVDE
ncbi:MAG TPA: hypothetical protein VIL97_00330 [Thermoanaerobaculia bacterium]